MATPSSKIRHAERMSSAQDILRVWRGDRCVSESSAQQYLQWIGRLDTTAVPSVLTKLLN